MTINYAAADAVTGVRIEDRIEQRKFVLRTDDPVSPAAADPDAFREPVTHACQFETSGLYIDRLDGFNIRDGDGDFIAGVQSHERRRFDRGEYVLDLNGPMKVYCRIEGPLKVRTGANYLELGFEGPTEVVLGMRSYHERPAGTITVSDDPRDVMTAVSHLPSALKTTSCERSYPTLRGHPPLFERGDALSVPDGLEPPDTGVRIVVPPTYRHVYAVSSLAFYLGAEVVPGDVPRIETDRGFERELASERWFEDEVARTLKQVFFLDCVVRTEGLYEIDLHERNRVEPFLPFDVASMYDNSLAEQVAAYLQIPYEVIAEYVPEWCLTAHVPSDPSGIRSLPFVAYDLGVVREPRGTKLSHPRVQSASYTRAATADANGDAAQATPLLRSGGESQESMTLVDPETTDESIEHAWFGDHVPRGATKATVDGFENRLRRGTRSSEISIAAVCNDERMIAEHDSLDSVYGNREGLPYETSFFTDLDMDGLATVLGGDYDFLHFIGHATADGLQCPDGELDIETLDSVGVDVFLLNACRSVHQALALTERGATGGVGTLSDVVNEQAVEIGRAMAHLLNLGFPLRAAVELIRDHTSTGDQYIVVGDGGADIAQSEGGTPLLCTVEEGPGDTYDLSIRAYPTREYQIGTYVMPTIDKVKQCFLTPGNMLDLRLSESELHSYLSSHRSPVQYDGKIFWNDTPGSVAIGSEE
ncbi:hypothetical protein [Halostella litorea]|uniref:hypothetical protein n=1 Tax=Halostella litorea TaxID=2528831 RepID=UPI00109219CA|nr:hypothetical protein [Halostella litorea]